MKSRLKKTGKKMAKKTRQYLKKLQGKIKKLSKKHNTLVKKLLKMHKKKHKHHKGKKKTQKGGGWVTDSLLNTYRGAETVYDNTIHTAKGEPLRINSNPAYQTSYYNDTIQNNVRVGDVLT
jgi:hypothetical protein